MTTSEQSGPSYTTSNTSQVVPVHKEKVSLIRLIWAAPLALAASLAAATVVRAIAQAVYAPAANYPQLMGTIYLSLSFLGVIGAIIVYILLILFLKRPI